MVLLRDTLLESPVVFLVLEMVLEMVLVLVLEGSVVFLVRVMVLVSRTWLAGRLCGRRTTFGRMEGRVGC